MPCAPDMTGSHRFGGFRKVSGWSLGVIRAPLPNAWDWQATLQTPSSLSLGGINFKSLSLSTSPVCKSVSICFLLGTHYIESWVEHPESSSGCGQEVGGGEEAGGSCQAQLFFRETQGRLSPSSTSLVTAPKPYPRFLGLFLSLRARQHPLQNTGRQERHLKGHLGRWERRLHVPRSSRRLGTEAVSL